jgi:hypothetical protein
MTNPGKSTKITERDRPDAAEMTAEELMKLIGNRPVAVNVKVHGELEVPPDSRGALIRNVETVSS